MQPAMNDYNQWNKLNQEFDELLGKVNNINQAGFEKAGYILIDEDVMKDMKYTPQHETAYNRDEVEVIPLGPPLDEPFHMNIEYMSNSDVITTIYNILYKVDTSNKESCLQLAEEVTMYIKQLLKLAEEN